MNSQKMKEFHALLNSTQQMPYKADIIMGATNGRTSSAKEMTDDEAETAVRYLKKIKMQQYAAKQPKMSEEDKQAYGEKCRNTRNKILAHAHNLGWEKQGGKVDYDRLNNWLTNKYGGELNKLSLEKLISAATALEQMRKKAITNTNIEP